MGLRNQAGPYLTARPASLSAFAVPPEAIRFKPTADRLLANSTRPVLSETLSKAETEDNFRHHWQHKRFCPPGPCAQGSSGPTPPSRLAGVGGGPGGSHARAGRTRGRGARRPAVQPGPAEGPARHRLAGRGRGAHRAGRAPCCRRRGPRRGDRGGDATCGDRRCAGRKRAAGGLRPAT